MSTSHPDPPAGSGHLTFDDQVSVVFGGGYPRTHSDRARPGPLAAAATSRTPNDA